MGRDCREGKESAGGKRRAVVGKGGRGGNGSSKNRWKVDSLDGSLRACSLKLGGQVISLRQWFSNSGPWTPAALASSGNY